MEISFIVPTLNEEDNIQKVIKLVENVTDVIFNEYEIIFTDDKSTDRTIKRIHEAMAKNHHIRYIVLPNREGLGNALARGVEDCKAKYVLFLDCDVSVNVKDLKNLVTNRASNKLLIGSRYIKGSKILGASVTKVFFSKLLNQIISFIFNVGAVDLSHSLRIFPAHDMHQATLLTHPGFFWEMTVSMKKRGMIISEIPVTFSEREMGVSKNKTIKMIVSVAKAMLRISRRSITRDW